MDEAPCTESHSKWGVQTRGAHISEEIGYRENGGELGIILRGVDAGAQIPKEDEDHIYFYSTSIRDIEGLLKRAEETGIPQDQFAITTKHAIM